MTFADRAEEQCESLQREECEVLESIFPDCITREKTRGLLKLEVPVEFERIHTVKIHQDGTLAHQSDKAKFQEASLSTLPPILLSILIPPTYPLLEPAQILSIRVTHFWLANTTGLLRSLNEMWQPGEGVLYNWVEYLRTGGFLPAMELAAGDKDIQLWHPAPLVLVASLKSYESLTRSAQFNNNAYLCTICFMTHKGSKCLQLSCSHTFCRACLADYWKLCIAEGDVGKVGCADHGCVREGREARLEEIARVVTEEEVRRWKWLREKRMYENDPSVVHCPMPFCQAAVPKPSTGGESNEEEDSGWARFRQCDSCSYTFCGLCQRLWHGPHTACVIEHGERVAQEYLEAEEGSAERRELERRYGRAKVVQLVQTYLTEVANREFIRGHTTRCPRCEVAVEKSQGCNHMTCRQCGTHFCYRCGHWLGGDPYGHYSRAGTSCYYKLFDEMEIE